MNHHDQFQYLFQLKETLDGRESKSVLTLENPSRLVHVQKDPKSGKVVTSIVREIVGDRLVQVILNKFKILNTIIDHFLNKFYFRLCL